MMANQIPYYEQWLGPWAMSADALGHTLELFRKTDLHLHLQAQQAVERSTGSYRSDVGSVAIIDLTGKLMKQEASLGGGTSTVLARREIRQAANDPNVSAILLRIDSPGGTAAGTKELADEIAAARSQKRVEAYVEDMAASAAYWAASQTERITANSTAIVGSIGTYGVVYDSSGQAAMEGVKVHVVKAGAFKGAGTPGTEITPDHLADMQRMVDGLNEHFLAGVASGRKIDREEIDSLADGRAHIAAEAKRMKLIDAIDSFDNVLNRLQKTASRRPKMQAELPTATVDAAVAVDLTKTQTTTVSDTPKPQPPAAASYQELVAGCVGADPSFICSQLSAGATLSAAQTAWMTEQNKRLAEATARPGVEAVGTVTTKGKQTAADPDAVSNWEALIVAEMATGKNRATATRDCVAQNPDAHLSYLASFNAQVKGS